MPVPIDTHVFMIGLAIGVPLLAVLTVLALFIRNADQERQRRRR